MCWKALGPVTYRVVERAMEQAALARQPAGIEENGPTEAGPSYSQGTHQTDVRDFVGEGRREPYSSTNNANAGHVADAPKTTLGCKHAADPRQVAPPVAACFHLVVVDHAATST